MSTLKADEETIFNVARHMKAPDSRRLYVQRSCGGDAALQERVDALLRVYDQERSFLELPAEGLQAAVIDSVRETLDEVTIPGYELVRLVGHGGMGAVYEAIHMADQQRMAVKVLIPNAKSGDRALQLFLREASILSQLDHPRIVRFHEVGWSEGRIFIAMEYVDQVDLSAVLAPRTPASRIRIVCGLVCQVLDALEFAHQRGLVHRDVKPTNILVTKKEKQLSAKLSDFGIAKSFETAGYSAMTGEGEARGTPGYMAPEQFTDSRHVKPAADIYSVGATLFRLLAERRPGECDRFATTLEVCEAVPVPLKEVLPAVPERLSEIVLRAMAHDPPRRFGSAGQMREALLPFAAGHD